MKKQIVINASKDRSRIAIVEDGQLVELYVENPDNVRSIGNVYLGRIQKVMPAIRAAFVDVGQKQDCFLHFSDLTDNLPQLQALAGEEVPGLDEPVLSLAPAKRVADDEDEPDVEDTLEVAPGDGESDKKKGSASRGRGRRSRGRGRGRRGRGRSEEEEQEEDRLDARFEEEEQEEGRRRLPAVVDLTSPPKRRAPKPAAEAAVATIEPEAAEPEAAVTEEAPKKPRKPRAKKAAAEPTEAEAPDAAAPEATEEAPKKPRRSRAKKKAVEPTEAETPEADAPDATEGDATEEAPKKARKSRAKATTEAPAEAEEEPTQAAADEAPDSDDDADDAAEEAGGRTRSRRKRRGRRGKGRRSKSADADAPSDDAPDAEADAAPAPRAKRATAKKASTPKKDDSPAEDAPEAEAPAKAPKAKTPKAKPTRAKKTASKGPSQGDVSPTGRSRRPTDIPEDDADSLPRASEDAPAPAKRRTKRAEPTADAASTEDAQAEDAQAEDAQADESGRKRLPRTLDLTGASARPSRRSASDSPPRSSGDAPDADAGTDSGTADDTDDTDGRSRRRSRGGRSKDAAAESRQPEAKAAEDSADDAPSSRRRGRRSEPKADDASGDDRKAQGRSRDDKKGDGRSRGRGSRDDARSSSDSRRGDSRSSGDSRRSDSRRSDSGNRGRSSTSGQRSGKIPSNEELLKRGARIIVKITKEAISNKGPRVSTDLSLAGRFLVLVPAADYVAVSKKIESAKERRRLRTLATSLKPDRFGVIVRTVAEGRDAKSLDQDLRLLVEKWRKIEAKLNQNPEPPVLLYQDVNMVSSVIRDLFSEDYDRILVDDPKVFKNVQAYIKAVAPDMADKVELHSGRTPVYRSLGIEKQVEEAFSKRVNMRGGGYLFIETTEAMHVVDVNSGRAGRGKSQKQNLIDVNVEAAREVAKQLRLRDLGGIIVVDFIDLKYDRDRKKVTDVLKEAFAKDRAVTKLLPMSDFGLVQITRQRLRPSITANATDEDGEPLDAAEAALAAGAGEIRRKGQQAAEAAYDEESDDRTHDRPADRAAERGADRADRPALSAEDSTPQALAGRLRGWLDHYRATVDDQYRGRPIVVKVHPLLGSYLRRGFPSPLTRWRLSLRGISWTIEEDATVDPLAFEVRDQKSGRSLLKKYSV